jgi:hypothetical protein
VAPKGDHISRAALSAQIQTILSLDRLIVEIALLKPAAETASTSATAAAVR